MALQAKVKSVLSGDTIILVNPKGAERTLSLAYISAPRPKREGDEPFAFQSRESIRTLLLGQQVRFEILYTIPTSKRDYGKVTLASGQELPDLIVQEGWAKVREDAGKKEGDEKALAYLDKLRELETQAKSESKGVWGKDGQISQVAESPEALVEQYKGQKVDAIVEKVISGDRMIARLMLSPQKHTQTLVVLAGVRTPATKRTSQEGKDLPAEPYGTEAHTFVEERLHQRKIVVELLGVTPQNQLIVHAIHPRGNIAKFLLDAGLARSNDQHVTLLGNDMASFRKAETEAKNARKGVFTGTSAAKAAGPQDADFIVSRVMNAEQIFVRTRAGEERKISLSSIRQPKPSDPKQAPFQADAKEFSRRKLIGKHVKVSIDGKRPASEGFDEREVATVIVNGKNIALNLVEAGYASVVRHRRDDQDRSPEYDALLLAEEAAQKDEKGMWSPKPPVAKQYQDYSESLQKAKMEASVLQRQKRVPAVVDYVRSGSRFVLLVPRENAKLTFVLSGIRTPKPARASGEAAEPFGQEASEFAVRRCMQRDVEIDVENLDKQGGFIGTMYVARENFARSLVEEGLSSVHAYSAEQSGNGNELLAAEQKAKEARKGMWHDYDSSKDVEESEAVPATNGSGVNGNSKEPASRRKDYRDVVITHVDETGKLKVQQVGSGTSALTELMSAFRTFHLNKANAQALNAPPRVGDVVAGHFTVDNEWYRARVKRVDRKKEEADVTYVDYGNSETLPWARLRPLTQSQFSTQKLKPQANDAVLSFVQLPTNENYLRDSVNYTLDQTEGRELVANVDYISPENTLHVTLFDPKISTKAEESVNAEVIREGFGMVQTKPRAWEKAATDILDSLKKLEDEAKEAHRGQWEYGDITED